MKTKTILLACFILSFIFNSWNGCSLAQKNLPPPLFEQIENEVKAQPTNKENVQIRFQILTDLALVFIKESGQENVDSIFPPEKHAQIIAALKNQNIGQVRPKGRTPSFSGAGRLIDTALLEFCKLGKKSSLANIRKVTFLSLEGVKVAGYLFIPEKQSKNGFVFGHGGFGRKELWIDVMKDVSKGANVFALAIDFEGCGESEGYTKWTGRIKDFSYAIDYLQKEFGLTRFAVGGHSGGGAYPSVCAAIEDKRISSVVLWDCPFDFYNMHIIKGASDPGGNPACLVERTYNESVKQNLPALPEIRNINSDEGLNKMYAEIENAIKYYRHPSQMLGEIQKNRQVAVLHIIAEDVLKPVSPIHGGETFFLPVSQNANESRADFLNRPLPFYASGLFNRPEGMWKRWENELGEPKKFVVIEKTTHAFEPPGRLKAVQETILWLQKYLPEK